MPSDPKTPQSNAAIYARYRSDNQREASIDDQVRVCRAEIERKGGTSSRSTRTEPSAVPRPSAPATRNSCSTRQPAPLTSWSPRAWTACRVTWRTW